MQGNFLDFGVDFNFDHLFKGFNVENIKEFFCLCEFCNLKFVEIGCR
jgi:hypothetical protein